MITTVMEPGLALRDDALNAVLFQGGRWKWAILWLQGHGQLSLWYYLMLCCYPLGGHRGYRGLGTSPCTYSQTLNTRDAEGKNPAGAQIFLATGLWIQPSKLLCF